MTDETTARILDLIDAAIEDDELGPDAVRYNAPAAPAESKWRRGGGDSITLRVEQTPFAYMGTPRMFLADGTEVPIRSFELAADYVRDFSDQMQRLVAPAMASASEAVKASYAAIGRLVAAFGLPQCTIGSPCACHPKPFPAARDYRRRTKHRNRRRKV